MVLIKETRQAIKDLSKAPKEILLSYETWARLIETHGPEILHKFTGYHDEKLKGEWGGYRSSRLNLKWRVIYIINQNDELTILNVHRITAHDYRRRK